MEIKAYNTKETAQLELKEFRLYDIGSQGLKMMLQGDFGKRFNDRYEISNIDYINRSATKPQKISASSSIYSDRMLYLNGNVIYQQGEDFTFASDEARYDEKMKRAYTSGKFNLKSRDGIFSGTALEYNSETQNVKAKAVAATYNLNKVN